MSAESTNAKNAPEGAICLNTRIGPLYFVEQSSIAEGIQRKGFHDVGVEYFMQKYSDRLFPFVDVGANVGMFSITAAGLDRQGTVIAFEPDATNLELLRKNLEWFGLDSVRVEATACSSKDGSIRMGMINCGLSRKSKQDASKVECQTLRSYCERQGIEPAFVKIDVEGAELDVLQGLLLESNYRNAIVELEFSWRDHGRHIEAILELLPPGQYDYEFLLTDSEREAFYAMEWPKDLWNEVYDRLYPTGFIACVARDRFQLERILELLRESTEALHSRKWELCITPKNSTRLPGKIQLNDFGWGRIGRIGKALRKMRLRKRS